jgi:hypothetical protein
MKDRKHKKKQGNRERKSNNRALDTVNIDTLADELLPGGRIPPGSVSIQVVVRANISLNKRVVAHIVAVALPWILLVLNHAGASP